MGKNILITRGTINKITPTFVEVLKKACQTVECYTVIGYDNQIGLFKDNSYCIKRTDCLNVDYDMYYRSLNINKEPIDTSDLNGFQRFLTPAMLMQRRFEERSMLNYSGLLSKHYEKIIKHLIFWNSFLEQKKIDVVVFSDAPHEVYDYIIYELCKRKNIHTYIYRYVYKTKRFILMEDLCDASKDCMHHYKVLKENNVPVENLQLDEELEVLYSSLLSQNNKELFSVDTSRIREFKYRFGQPNIFSFIADNIKHSKENSISAIKIFKYIHNFFFIQKKKYDTKKLVRNYEKRSVPPCLSDSYIYFALHLLPESAAEPLGGVFSEQFWAVYLISCYMPTGWKLYIKMHPAQVSTVVTSDYIDLLMSIPNVKIISLNSEQQELIKHAKAVATLTGEIALEALFADVTCFVFGHTYYEALPNSIPIKSKADMKRAFDIVQQPTIQIQDEERRLFFKALQNSSYKGTKALIDEICNRIERLCNNENRV